MRLRTVFTAEYKYIANGLVRKRCRYPQSVRDHGQILFICQFESEDAGGRASIDNQSFAILDQCRCALRDTSFLGRSKIDPLRKGRLTLDEVICGDRASMGPSHETANREEIQISA